MIAIVNTTRRTMLAKGRTTTYTGNTDGNTYAASDSTCWREVGGYKIAVVVDWYEDPATEQDEPNTGREAPVHWERHNRRLATVTRAARDKIPQQASTYG